MVLLAAAGAASAWNVVATSVGRKLVGGGGSFTLHHLPAGEYHLFHHLGDDDAWGGFEVTLAPGKTTRVGRLGSRAPGPLTVEVVDAGGRPVDDAIPRIRDRLHEAWTKFVATARSTAVYADNPLPAPPAAWLRGKPVTFDAVRPGWVELALDHPAGPTRHFLRKAEPGSVLRLVVDD